MSKQYILDDWKRSALPASGSTISGGTTASNGNTGFKGGGTTGDNTTTDPYAVDLLNMPGPERLSLSKLLKDAKYLKSATSKYNKDFADAYIMAAQDAASEAIRTGRTALTIRDFLKENYQAPTSTGAGASLPQREIYKKTEADRIAMLNQVSQTLRGQDITEEDKTQKWYTDLKKSIDKMIDAGSVRTVTKQVNPKTKKLESVAVTVPGYSEEQIAATAEQAIRKATPEEVARKERVDFTGWLFKSLGGN